MRAILDVPVATDGFGTLSGWQHDVAGMMRQHGGEWDPGSRRWLIERRRIGPVLRALRRHTDPLFRQAGISLDG